MKCKNNSQKLPCTSNSDVDVQSFILPHLQTAPNCLVTIATDIIFEWRVRDTVFNATFNNISFFLLEELEYPEKTTNLLQVEVRQTLYYNVVSRKPHHERDSN